MRTAHILLLCMLGAALLSSVVCNNAIGPDECCFRYYPRKLKRDLIKSYSTSADQCPKTGVIFLTRKSRHVCVDPNLSWVQGIMKSLDKASF